MQPKVKGNQINRNRLCEFQSASASDWLVRFPNCHECQVASGLGNLTSDWRPSFPEDFSEDGGDHRYEIELWHDWPKDLTIFGTRDAKIYLILGSSQKPVEFIFKPSTEIVCKMCAEHSENVTLNPVTLKPVTTKSVAHKPVTLKPLKLVTIWV